MVSGRWDSDWGILMEESHAKSSAQIFCLVLFLIKISHNSLSLRVCNRAYKRTWYLKRTDVNRDAPTVRICSSCAWSLEGLRNLYRKWSKSQYEEVPWISLLKCRMDASLICDHLGDVHLFDVDTIVQVYSFEQSVLFNALDRLHINKIVLERALEDTSAFFSVNMSLLTLSEI